MKEKLKTNKGITLIALIITIIVLLILAAVAIAAIKGDGIIAHAKNAKSQYSKAQQDEASMLAGYELTLAEANGKKLDITDAQSSGMLTRTSNTTVYDKYGNKIKVPAGFKILVDSTTGYTADTIDVTKGIVVEDGEGNQFVWIPVGTIYTDAEKTEANAKIITLGRYENFTKTNNAYTVAQNANDYGTQVKISDCTEDTAENHDSNYKNSIAKNIGEFCTKSLASGGYYLGRYEARVGATERKSKTDTLTPVTLKANDYVYNYVTQPQALERCQSIYTNKPYESDLVNSYAWDTAIIFFQEFGGNEGSDYAEKTSVNNHDYANTGTSGTSYTGTKDVMCNVYDMASNCWEWSTETLIYSEYPCTLRGGCIYGYEASYRNGYFRTTDTFEYVSFRPILYM